MWYSAYKFTRHGQPSGLAYIHTYETCTRGEFLRNLGFDANVVYDNLYRHAKAYRQMALLVKSPPGREAFPGDMFYQQGRLLERSAQLRKKYGYGSLSGMPVYETMKDNFRNYICTNLISITDGQYFYTKKVWNEKLRPAVDANTSVSRVGSMAQSNVLSWASQKIIKSFSRYFKIKRRLRFINWEELSIHHRYWFKIGKSGFGVWKQNLDDLTNTEDQVWLNMAFISGHLCFKKARTAAKVILFKFQDSQYKFFSRFIAWMACATREKYLSTAFIIGAYVYINFDRTYYSKLNQFIEVKKDNRKAAKKAPSKKKSPKKSDSRNKDKGFVSSHDWNNVFYGAGNILNGISRKVLFFPKKNRYGFVLASDQYCVKTDGLFHAKLGCLLWAHHKGHLAYAMKLNRKHVYANYLHKGNGVVIGDILVIKEMVMKISNDFSMFGVHSESKYAPLITIHDINRARLAKEEATKVGSNFVSIAAAGISSSSESFTLKCWGFLLVCQLLFM